MAKTQTMTTLDPLGEAGRLAASRASKARQAYAAMITRLGAGDVKVKPEDVIATAEAAGKSLDAVQSDVELLAARAESAAKVQALPTIKRQLEANAKEIAQADAILEDAKRLHEESVTPLRNI